jgi:hypothetical protein
LVVPFFRVAQELNDESYAICKTDLLVKGQDANNIKCGNSFSADGLHNLRADYLISNPPFGVDWSKAEKTVQDEHQREFDMVAAWSVDRLGRSLKDLLSFLEELNSAGIHLFLHQQALDTTTPSGRALFQMLGVFSEFERAMIQERVRAGLERAKAQGKRLGRPKVSASVERAVRHERATGKGIRKIASELGIGVGTVQRIVNAA